MNSEIKIVLENIKVAGQSVPVALMYYDGEADTFMVYSPASERVGLAADDTPQKLIESWDVDVYSNRNYKELALAVKKAMIAAGWVYKGSGSDTYDRDTKLYHRLLEFETQTNDNLTQGEL